MTARPCYPLAIDESLSGRRRVESGADIEQRALAASARPDEATTSPSAIEKLTPSIAVRLARPLASAKRIVTSAKFQPVHADAERLVRIRVRIVDRKKYRRKEIGAERGRMLARPPRRARQDADGTKRNSVAIMAVFSHGVLQCCVLALALSLGLPRCSTPALPPKASRICSAPPILPAFGPIQLAKGKGYFSDAGWM